jgi:hypothetical protein
MLQRLGQGGLGQSYVWVIRKGRSLECSETKWDSWEGIFLHLHLQMDPLMFKIWFSASYCLLYWPDLCPDLLCSYMCIVLTVYAVFTYPDDRSSSFCELSSTLYGSMSQKTVNVGCCEFGGDRKTSMYLSRCKISNPKMLDTSNSWMTFTVKCFENSDKTLQIYAKFIYSACECCIPIFDCKYWSKSVIIMCVNVILLCIQFLYEVLFTLSNWLSILFLGEIYIFG